MDQLQALQNSNELVIHDSNLLKVLQESADPEEVAHLKEMSPLCNQIVDSAIDNMTRKLIAGYRNKNNAKPNANKVDVSAELQETFKATSAESVVAVANRGQAWKELIQKSLTHGVSSLATMKFDGEFHVKGGRPENFNETKMPKTPGVYVVFDDVTGKPVYVGDSDNMFSRWNAGHFNEFMQGQKQDSKPYKLANEFENGCTVKFIVMESKETAAALEAHLIKENFNNFKDVAKKDNKLSPETEQAARQEAIDGGMLKNIRGELETEQGTRSNQEAKKMKDSSGATSSLAQGAALEGLKNVGFDVFERLSTTIIKAVKSELVDILRGGKAKIAARVKRLLDKILGVLKGIIDKPLELLRGLVEFVVNALSKAIGQIYNLARNIFDLANGSWNLYQGSKAMSREELVRTISSTVIVSASLMTWNAVDPVIEAKLVTFLGPFAPYISAALVAIGFGLSSYALNSIVTKIIDAVIAFKQGFLDSLEATRNACDQLIRVAEKELEIMADLGEYLKSSLVLMDQLQSHTKALSSHQTIQPLVLPQLKRSRD